MFVDNVELSLLSGAGGSGSISFKSKGTKSSPNGGSGGDGGSIYFKTDKKIYDFSSIYSNSSFKAENGEDAGKDFQDGKSGKDLFISIPIGTSILINNEKVAEILEEDISYLICKGGKGGKGNKELISKRNPNPKISESGEKRKKINVSLQLSLITDIAILGLPNSGKSTLIKTLTNSNAKTGSYPFTTISPNLGVFESKQKNLLICDLPGLIEGASDGAGLGIKFLKHISRTGLLLIFADLFSFENINPIKQVQLLKNELDSFKDDLTQKISWIVCNKIDLLSDEDISQIRKDLENELQVTHDEVFFISAATGEGTSELLKRLETELLKDKQK